MKTFKLIIVALLLFFSVSGQAQISVNVNLGSPPQWGPAGYTNVQYYYLPDVEAYYDVPTSQFIYLNGGTWVRRATLPSRYRTYDLYNGYKVVMSDYHGKTPFSNFREHKKQYAKGYRGKEQHNIGKKPDHGYPNDRNYSRNKSNQKMSNGRENQHDNGKKMKNNSENRKGNNKKNK